VKSGKGGRILPFLAAKKDSYKPTKLRLRCRLGVKVLCPPHR
jgi:hypothetical protein